MSNNFNPQKVAHFKSKFAKPSNNAQPTPQAPPAPAAPAPQQAHSQAPAQSHVPVQPQAPAQSQQAPAQPQVIPPQPATAQPATASADGSKTSRILMGVSALILVAALAVGGTYLFMRNDDGTVSSQGTATEDQPATGDEDQPATGPDQASLADDDTVDTAPDGADDSGTSGTSSEENLDQKVEEDKVVVDQNLIGKWVPQIASKKVGMEADGKVWDADAIYEEHQELANEYGTSQVLLLKSEDYASYRQPGYYVTVIDSSYDNPDDALQWCTFHSLDADHCYAKQINTTGGPDGTTRLQK